MAPQLVSVPVAVAANGLIVPSQPVALQFCELRHSQVPKPRLARNDNITNNLAVGVNGGANSTLTFDANGNMTSDGTNSFAWDAENRLIKITYPGTNNFTDLSYDGSSQNVRIVETTAGGVE